MRTKKKSGDDEWIVMKGDRAVADPFQVVLLTVPLQSPEAEPDREEIQ